MERGEEGDEEEGRTGMCVVTGKKQGNCENSLLSYLFTQTKARKKQKLGNNNNNNNNLTRKREA